jgi:chromosome segregation ATPase
MERLPLPSWVPPLLGLLAAAAVFTLGSQPAIAAIAAVAAGVAGWAIGSRAELLLGRADEDRLALREAETRTRQSERTLQEHSAQAQTLQSQLHLAQQQVADLTARLQQLDGDNRNYQLQLRTHELETRALQSRLQEVGARVTDADARAQAADARAQSAEARASSVEARAQAAEAELRLAPRGNVGNSARELEALHDELEALQRTASETRARLSAELEHLRETHERAQTELRQSRAASPRSPASATAPCATPCSCKR